MKTFVIKLFAVVLAIFCSIYAVTASASEAITNFVSNIYIHANGSADVIETITIRFEKTPVRFGIMRWLPVYIKDNNQLLTIGYTIGNATVNGLPAPEHVSNNGKQLVVAIGSKKQPLPAGTYIYTLQYHLHSAVVFGAHADQFYWDFTGNNWPYRIDNLDATVHLPPGAGLIKYAGFTGKPGSIAKNFFTTTALGSNQVNFTTTSTLKSGESLIIGLSWPIGYVHKTSSSMGALAGLLYQSGNKVALLFTLLLLFYFISAWCRECRPAGALFPQMQPPPLLSAAGLRYVVNMGYDLKIFTITILSLAMKGFLTIEEDPDKNFLLVKQLKQPDGLTATEVKTGKKLFGDKTFLSLDSAGADRIRAAQKQLKKNLSAEFENTFFVMHLSYVLFGFLLGLGSLVALAFAAHNIRPVILFGLLVTLLITLLSFQLPKAWRATTDYAREPGAFSKLSSLLVFRHLLVSFGLLFLVALLIGPLAAVMSLGGIFLLALNIFLQVLFYHLLKTHTRQGRKLMDQIAAFKLYLLASTSRKGKLKPAPHTPALFEKYLPYACALDVEDSWLEQFVAVLYSAKSGKQSYHPLWYKGPGDFNIQDVEEFVTALSNRLAMSL